MIGKLLVVIALAFSQVAFAAVQLNVKRTEISVNDNFVLVVRGTENESLRNADYRPLERDFRIGGASDKSAITIKNGQTTRVNELHIELTPKRTGSLMIPALKVDGYLTNPIQITVKEKRQDVYVRDLFFVEAQLDKHEAYIQEQLLLYVRIYRAVDIDDLKWEGLELATAEFQRVGNNTFNRNIDGLNYRIDELIFTVFPQQEGVLKIPPVEFTGLQRTRSRSIFDRGTLVRRRSEPLSVTVKSIPASFPGRDWLPSSLLEISEDWSTDLAALKVGDSVTRTITVKATGLTGIQLPPLDTPSVRGIKIYPDQPAAEDITAQTGITALGVNSSAWVVTEPGQFNIPALEIPWWDTEQDVLRIARLPSLTLSVVAGPNPAARESSTPVPQPGLETAAAGIADLWPWVSVALGLAWLITLFLLLRLYSRGSSGKPTPQRAGPDRDALFAQLDKACRNHRAQQARELALALTVVIFPHQHNPGVRQLGSIGSPALQSSLEQLDDQLYGADSGTWNGKELAAALKQLRAELKRNRVPRDRLNLPPLYSGSS